MKSSAVRPQINNAARIELQNLKAIQMKNCLRDDIP